MDRDNRSIYTINSNSIIIDKSSGLLVRTVEGYQTGRVAAPPWVNLVDWIQQVDNIAIDNNSQSGWEQLSSTTNASAMQDICFPIRIRHIDTAGGPHSDSSSLQRETLQIQRAFPDEFDPIDRNMQPDSIVSAVHSLASESASLIRRQAASVLSSHNSECIRSQPSISQPSPAAVMVQHRPESATVPHARLERPASPSANYKLPKSQCRSPTSASC